MKDSFFEEIITPARQSKLSDAEKFSKKIIDHFNLSKQFGENDLKNLHEELIKKYEICSPYLDSKFLSNLLSDDQIQVASGLWETIIVDYLKKSQAVHCIEHKDDGPDWKVTLKNNAKYFIEATCAGLPTKIKNSEIHRLCGEMQDKKPSSYDGKLIQEAKSRISNSIHEKLKKHDSFMIDQECVYLLLVSYGNLPFYATCDLYNAVQTIYPIGELMLTFRIGESNPEILQQSLKY